MAVEKKVTEFLKNLSEIYGTAYDFVRSKHPDVFPPWDQRYVEKPESASHIYKKVSESSPDGGLQVLQETLRTGDKNPVTKAKEAETVRVLRDAIEKEEKNTAKTTPKKVKA